MKGLVDSALNLTEVKGKAERQDSEFDNEGAEKVKMNCGLISF